MIVFLQTLEICENLLAQDIVLPSPEDGLTHGALSTGPSWREQLVIAPDGTVRFLSSSNFSRVASSDGKTTEQYIAQRHITITRLVSELLCESQDGLVSGPVPGRAAAYFMQDGAEPSELLARILTADVEAEDVESLVSILKSGIRAELRRIVHERAPIEPCRSIGLEPRKEPGSTDWREAY